MTAATIERPDGIDPDRWARAPWHAKRKIIDARNREMRTLLQTAEDAEAEAEARDAQRLAELIANVEAARAEHEALYRPWDQTVEVPQREQRASVVSAAERVDQVELLREADYTPSQIIQQLNVTPTALERALDRAGRRDLARLFGSLSREAQKVPCVDCGFRVHRPAKRCRKHAALARVRRAA